MFDTPAKALGYILVYLSAIISAVTYKKYKNTPSRYFLWFLGLTVFVELLGLIQYYYYYYDPEVGGSLIAFVKRLISKGYLSELYVIENSWLYNLYRFITYLIYIYYYYLLTKSLKKKKQIVYILIFCAVIFSIDLIINRDVFIYEKLLFTRITGGLFILISSAIYLMEVLKSDELLSFHKTLPFWITIGALIYYLTTIPIFIFKEYLYLSNSYSYNMILYLSNYFLYGTFITGFIINAVEFNKREKVRMENEKL